MTAQCLSSHAALALAGVVATSAGCGGADGTPARTTTGGLAVFNAEHNVVNLAAGPRVVIHMPEPGDDVEWRLFSAPDDMGGVSLTGMASANGAGHRTFDTIGAGTGTLEFQQLPAGSATPSQSVTYEVNIK